MTGTTSEHYPMVPLAPAGPARPLPPTTAPRPVPAAVLDLLARHRSAGLVVLARGRCVHEWHRPGLDPARPQRTFSISKSIAGLLAAVAIERGLLRRSDRVGDLVPEMAESGAADATVAQVADMTLAWGYDEEYEGGHGHAGRRGFRDYLVALGNAGDDVAADAPRTVRHLLAAIGRDRSGRRHGERFAYATPATDLLAWLTERAHRRSWKALFLAEVWRPAGAQHAAHLLVDDEGTAVAGGGLLLSVRDLARLGLLVLDRHADGTWHDAIETIRGGGDPEVFRRGDGHTHLAGYTYRDQWWLPPGPTRPLVARGIHGQLLWIEPDAGIVIAVQGDGPRPTDERRDLDLHALCRTIVDDTVR